MYNTPADDFVNLGRMI